MDVLRTPDERFAGLPDFGYEPQYVTVGTPGGDDVRMAYVAAGPGDGPVVLLLHGEPSWSFLYRTMLPVLAGRGLRAIAPDLVGFGRSDKPARVADHSYARHVEWLRALAFDRLDLRQVTLVGQDWGGLLGLRLVAEHPDRFARVVAANTGLPTGDEPMPEVWWQFRRVVEKAPDLDVARLVQSGCRTRLSGPELAAYAAPFPDESFKAGPRAMPLILPTAPDDPATEANRAAWQQLQAWDRPFLVAFSDGDPITASMAPVLKETIPGAAGRDHPVIEGAGHFLQEDAGPRLAGVVADFALGSLCRTALSLPGGGWTIGSLSSYDRVAASWRPPPDHLTGAGRLRKSLLLAATGRRAVEHPPRPGFHRRRGFALSVVNVTGHLLHRVAGGRGCRGEACHDQGRQLQEGCPAPRRGDRAALHRSTHRSRGSRGADAPRASP